MRRGNSNADELLQVILRTQREVVEPVIDLSRIEGFYYPFLEEEGWNPAIVEPLEELVNQGELEKSVKHKLLLCPDDGDPHLRPVPLCPSCRSEDLSKEVLIEHFSCGHVAPESEFRQADNLLCAKCGKRLRLLGKDYGRPADFHRCGHCKEVTHVPEVSLHCSNCDKYSTVSDVREKLLHSYYRKESQPSRIRELLDHASEILRGAGYHVSVFEKVKGRSGLEHHCDLHASRVMSGLKTEFLMEAAIASEAVSSKPLISLFGKAEDLGISNILFVAVPALEPSAKDYAGFYGIKVLEATWEGIRSELPEFLAEELLLEGLAEER